MQTNNSLLIVGGTGRNVGKTEFICRLIRKVHTIVPVYALKVSAIFPDEGIYHGNHSTDSAQQLFEETRPATGKDTSRMLAAGARRVFYLRGEDRDIREGYAHFLSMLPGSGVIICESNSLDNHVRPALQIMLKSAQGEIKPRAAERLLHADLVVVSDGKSGFPELGRISCSAEKGWYLIK